MAFAFAVILGMELVKEVEWLILALNCLMAFFEDLAEGEVCVAGDFEDGKESVLFYFEKVEGFAACQLVGELHKCWLITTPLLCRKKPINNISSCLQYSK